MNIRIEVDINILYSWAHIKGHLPAGFRLASPGFEYSKATFERYIVIYVYCCIAFSIGLAVPPKQTETNNLNNHVEPSDNYLSDNISVYHGIIFLKPEVVQNFGH